MSDEKILELTNNTVLDNELLTELTDILSNIVDSSSIAKLILYLLNLDDEKFDVVAPAVLDAFNRELKNPNETIVLTQTLNTLGYTVEDLQLMFSDLTTSIFAVDDYSETKRNFIVQLFGGILDAIGETQHISKKVLAVAIERIDERAKLPEYAHKSDSGADVFALEDVTITPGETKLIHTGLKAAIPPGYELQVRPKSGRSLKTKLRVANTPGTIDAGYRDEICIIVENVEPPIKDITTDYVNGELKVTSILYGQSYFIGAGEKVAQLILSEVPKAGFYEVKSVLTVEGTDADRGGGFGSSGLK